MLYLSSLCNCELSLWLIPFSLYLVSYKHLLCLSFPMVFSCTLHWLCYFPDLWSQNSDIKYETETKSLNWKQNLIWNTKLHQLCGYIWWILAVAALCCWGGAAPMSCLLILLLTWLLQILLCCGLMLQSILKLCAVAITSASNATKIKTLQHGIIKPQVS